MLDRIIKFSLHNRVLIIVAAVLLLVGGLYTTLHTEVDIFPDLNAPTVVVMTEAHGMAAEEVEQLVTYPVETAMNGATDVRRVRSSSTTGFSVVWVEFDWGTDIMLARQIVSEKLQTVTSSLPPGVGEPTLGPQSSILGEMFIVGLTSDSTSMLELRTIADWIIRPRLLSMGGVAQVAVMGGDVKEYRIALDPNRMRHFDVSLSEVLEATEEMNVNVSGGVLYEYGNEYIIKGILSSNDVDALQRAVVKAPSRDGEPAIRLGDVAEVKIAGKTPKTGIGSVEGKPAVLLTVTKQPATGTIDLTEKVEAALEDVRKNLPSDVKVHTDIFRQSEFIENSIGNVKEALIEGGIFVVVILILFLANVRTTVISVVTLPLAMIAALLALHCLGLTINTMSLGGLAIAVGSLVDDAIVDVENVYRRLHENGSLPADRRRAVIEVVYSASREVRLPILNSTLIIVVSFIPLFFLTGMEGRMLVPLGIAFIVALCASTVVALTLTPVLCSYLLGSKKKDGEENRPSDPALVRYIRRGYAFALDKALEHRRAVLGGAIGLFVVALVVFFTLGRSFLPAFNEGSLTINVSSLPGISLEESDRLGRRAEELLLEIPEIKTVARKTGRAELDEHALGVNASELEAPFKLEGRSRSELMADVRSRLGSLSGASIEIGQPISHRIDAMLSGTQASIAVKLFGDDLTRMFALAGQIKQAVADVEGLVDLNVEPQVERPELIIVPRREMLADYGITMSQFSTFIRVCLGGEVVSQVYEDGKTFDLTVRVADDYIDTMDKLHDLSIDTPDGHKVPLDYVADLRSTTGPSTINRENVKRRIVISANVEGRDLRGVVNEMQARIDKEVSLPEGYHIEYGGQFESEQAASRTLALASCLAIVVIFLLLNNEFHNIRESGVVLINLPLALIGGVFALLLSSGEISIPAIIGFISLFGIATRNGMLLINRYNYLRGEGKSLAESIRQGSIDRLNPILMTALSSALALIPLAWNGELPGNEIQSPMAKVILGGLLTSTLLNGFIIPIVYSFLYKSEE